MGFESSFSAIAAGGVLEIGRVRPCDQRFAISAVHGLTWVMIVSLTDGDLAHLDLRASRCPTISRTVGAII